MKAARGSAKGTLDGYQLSDFNVLQFTLYFASKNVSACLEKPEKRGSKKKPAKARYERSRSACTGVHVNPCSTVFHQFIS